MYRVENSYPGVAWGISGTGTCFTVGGGRDGQLAISIKCTTPVGYFEIVTIVTYIM